MYINPNVYIELKDCYRLDIIYKGNIHSTYFDKSQYDKISKYHWRLSKKKEKLYVCTGQNKNGNKIIYMSNLLINFIPDKVQEVDHIDGNSLNNLMVNLRLINRIDNIRNTKVRVDNNTTKIRGVSLYRKYGTYVVDFYYNKNRIYFKHFKQLNEAVYVRYICEIMVLKEFRNTSDDEYKSNLINELSEIQKNDLKDYVINKLTLKGFI